MAQARKVVKKQKAAGVRTTTKGRRGGAQKGGAGRGGVKSRSAAKSPRGRRRIGIRDRLGQLTYRAACRLMGDDAGEARLRRGGRFESDLANDVYLGGDTLRVNVPDPDLVGRPAIVTVVEMTNKPKGLHLHCDQCEVRCDHIAAVACSGKIFLKNDDGDV